MGSVRLSGFLARSMGIEESIYAEKTNPHKKLVGDIQKRIGNALANENDSDALLDIQNMIQNVPRESMALSRHDIDL